MHMLLPSKLSACLSPFLLPMNRSFYHQILLGMSLCVLSGCLPGFFHMLRCGLSPTHAHDRNLVSIFVPATHSISGSSSAAMSVRDSGELTFRISGTNALRQSLASGDKDKDTSLSPTSKEKTKTRGRPPKDKAKADPPISATA
jgi:hypothetical protein